MNFPLETFPCYDSPAGQLDARWKLAALGLAAGTIGFLQTLPPTLSGLGIAWGLVLWSRLPLGWYGKRLRGLIFFLAPIVVGLTLLVPDPDPLIKLGVLAISRHGSYIAMVVTCKAVAIVSLILVMLGTTPLTATLQAAHKLRLPGILVHLALLTYRYVWLLASEFGRLRIAVRVRGYRNRANVHSFRTIGHVAGTLLVRSSERAERVGQAMRCRGFDGRFRSLSEFRTTVLDVGFFLSMVGGAGGLLVWDLTRR
jgi:cobalt/nickel transport system permease protein